MFDHVRGLKTWDVSTTHTAKKWPLALMIGENGRF
jgi:hypothetical protein